MCHVEGLDLRVYHSPRVAHEMYDEKSGGVAVRAAHPGVCADSFHDYSPDEFERLERKERAPGYGGMNRAPVEVDVVGL